MRGPLYWHGKLCSSFFNVYLGTAPLKQERHSYICEFLVLTWQRFTCDFSLAGNKINMAEQLHGSLFWKSENVCQNCLRDETRSSRAALLHTLKRRHWQLAARYSGLYNRIQSSFFYYQTVGQIYQNWLKSHLNSPRWEKMTTFNVQEYLFGK